jgi:2-polyprenyl-6-methoxyphenol hydroxylase-like FAD-dependent oxidoreductase
MLRTPVLIVGAGPTGLVLAMSLARRGIPLRIISQAGGPGEHSRAIIVQARTLEFYRQFGFAEQALAAGIQITGGHLRYGGSETEEGRELASLNFADIGQGLSPYPTVLSLPQDDHERFLIDRLAELDVRIEWNTRLASFTQDAAGITATVTRDGRTETIEADFLCGCDGARSAVRQTLGIDFPGGTYPQLYYVVDCRTEGGFERDLVFNLGKDMFVLLLPVRSRGVQRLIGLVPRDIPERPDLDFEDIRRSVEPLLGRRVLEVNWFSTYRVHHRVAERFQTVRAFLLGDAGHIHSPAGAQGMNTGIGDAINLGWKLAMVLQRRAPIALLDSYEPERIAFARRLVETTDRVFTAAVAGGISGRITRRALMPLIFMLGTSTRFGRHAIFRLLSQIQIEYEDSDVSEGQVGRLAAGERLPWVPSVDNFGPLASLDWQVHVHGTSSEALRALCAARHIPLHVFPWTSDADDAGFERDAFYLVRPDGYIGVDAGRDETNRLDEYWASHGFSMLPTTPPFPQA